MKSDFEFFTKDQKATVRNWERNGYSSRDSGQSNSGEPDESWGMVLLLSNI